MKATDLPALRRSVTQWLQSDHGRQVWAGISRAGFFGMPLSNFGPHAVETFRSDEVTRWRMAELFHVTRDMTELAKVAGQSLPNARFRAADLPAPFGVMVFESPIGETGEGAERAPTIACAWGITRHFDQSQRPFLVVTMWSDSLEVRRRGLALGRYTHEQVALLGRTNPVITYDSESAFLLDDESPPVGEDHKTARAVMAAFLLMQQQIPSVHRLQPRKSELRAMRRKNLDPSAVRIVSLRHRKGDLIGEPSDGRTYSHRWIVRGHWRNQWYPSQERHVPLWINAHVKGPDGAPMLTGEVVNAWSR